MACGGPGHGLLTQHNPGQVQAGHRLAAHLVLGGIELPLLVVVQGVHVDTAGDEDVS